MKHVTVSLDRAEAIVEFDDTSTTAERLVAAIGLLGFQARLKDVGGPRS